MIFFTDVYDKERTIDGSIVKRQSVKMCALFLMLDSVVDRMVASNSLTKVCDSTRTSRREETTDRWDTTTPPSSEHLAKYFICTLGRAR